MKRSLGILGAGAFGRLVGQLARETGHWDHISFFDDVAEPGGKVLGEIADVESHFRQGRISEVIIAIGYKHFRFRQQLFDRYSESIPFAKCIHPTVAVSETAAIEPGAIIFSQCNVDAFARVGANVTIFNQTSITHDVQVGSHSFLSVSVGLGGGVKIGERSFLGIHATVVPEISVGNDCIVCAGTLLTRDLADGKCVIGNPWKEIPRVEL